MTILLKRNSNNDKHFSTYQKYIKIGGTVVLNWVDNSFRSNLPATIDFSSIKEENKNILSFQGDLNCFDYIKKV